MTPLTLLAFLAGLLLLVFSMLTGVERPARAPARMAGAADGRASASSLVPMTGAFLAAFGATGYLLVRYTVLGPLTLLLVAAVAGALGALGALGLVAKWAVPGALADPIDERYLLQGHFAIVTTAIGVGTVGAIRYDDGGTSRAVRGPREKGWDRRFRRAARTPIGD